MRQYLLNILEWCSHTLNVFSGGDPDSCLCSRLYRNHYDSWLRKWIDLIFGENHCKRAAENEFKDDSVLR